MTSPASHGAPDDLKQAFRRLAEEQGAAPGAIVDSGHLKRQSLAAHHFVEAVGHRIRFDHSRQDWFVWHGHRWRRDLNGEIRRIWLEVLATRYREALAIADGDRRERIVAAIHAAGATDGAIESGLRIAGSMEPVAIEGSEWDPNPWLLGCENGVVDLRTGKLRDGRPEDLMTRSTRLAYDHGAPRKRWERFLVEVFAGDGELVTWFRRLIGASLVGTSKEIVAVHHGGGNNGKSVCFRQLGLSVGDYGIEVAIETVLASKRQAGAPSPDLMRLRGARLAFTSEPDLRARLSGGTLKRLATIDQMVGRDLHQGQQEWEPTHTIHLATNHLPDVDDPSDGLWRRIALVRWHVHFLKDGEPGDGPREDRGLGDDLATESAGVLAWIVEGAAEFAAGAGLHPFPTAVQAATETYRADQEPLRGFLAYIAPSDDQLAVTTSKLYAAYDAWADRDGLSKAERLTSRSFGKSFADCATRLTFTVKRGLVGGRTAYRGLRILTEPLEDTEDGGSGGFDDPPAGSSNTSGESRETSDPAERPTTPTTPDVTGIDEELAERATDDDGELSAR